VNHDCFWRDVKDAIAFLQPFSDFIHQVEADRPALARVHCGILELQKHVDVTGKKKECDRESEGMADLMVRTFERRLTGSSGLARLYQHAFAAAYALDPLYGNVKSEQFVDLPHLSDEHETMARTVILLVGGAQAVT
jgi:hypothetical protein